MGKLTDFLLEDAPAGAEETLEVDIPGFPHPFLVRAITEGENKALRRGCRRVAGIFKGDDLQGHRRYAGYTQALREAGLPVVDDRVLWYTTEDRVDLLEAAVPNLLRGCYGLVCYNDQVAYQVLEVARRRGITPPRLASFDHSVFAQVSPTPFLSLYSPKEELGRQAAEKLLQMLRGRRESSVLLPWRLEEEPSPENTADNSPAQL